MKSYPTPESRREAWLAETARERFISEGLPVLGVAIMPGLGAPFRSRALVELMRFVGEPRRVIESTLYNDWHMEHSMIREECETFVQDVISKWKKLVDTAVNK